MTHNLYLIAAVLFRTGGVFLILHSLYSYIVALVFGAFAGSFLPAVSVTALLVPVVAGFVLWFLAKPVARLVTSAL